MEKQEFEKIIKMEGVFLEGKIFGLPFMIWRHPEFKHWCGYVGVSKNSRLYGKGYYTSSESENGISTLEQAINDISVHGGLTFVGKMSDKGEKDIWYFGFDCAHSGDLVAYMFDYQNLNDSKDTYKDKEFVLSEVESLARQLKKIIDLKL